MASLEIHRIPLHINWDSKHPSSKKIRIKAFGIPGAFWVNEDQDYEEIATKWIAALMNWPEHLVDAFIASES